MNQDDEQRAYNKEEARTRKDSGFFSTERLKTKSIVVVPVLHASANANPRSGEARLEEAVGLANAISDLDVVHGEHFPLRTPRPATLIGQGKLDELKAIAKAEKVDLLVVDQSLTPIQQRNLERYLHLKVLDRTGLILEIFGERAQTKEGRLQVELAHLNYQRGRLVRSWTHLERQRGGFGFLGGPGETQIEADRRMLQQRIKHLEDALEDVRRTRHLHRKNRKRKPHPVVALVGYTNAGKSTLFNRITHASVMAKDLLFATLDPTLRTVDLPHGDTIILSDTVGFISDLPTDLVAAFRATLEEVTEADLILHMRDIAHDDSDAQAQDVMSILKSMEIDPRNASRIIEVWNKVDLLPKDDWRHTAGQDIERSPAVVPISAETGQGIDALIRLIETHIMRDRSVFDVVVPLDKAAELYWFYERAEVLGRDENQEDGAVHLQVRVDRKSLDEFRNRFGDLIQAA